MSPVVVSCNFVAWVANISMWFWSKERQRNDGEWDFLFWPREKWKECHFLRGERGREGLTLIPCSLLWNHMETLATQARNYAQFCWMVPTLLVWVGMIVAQRWHGWKLLEQLGHKILGAELIVFYSKKKKHDYLEPMVDFVQWSMLFKLKWLVLIL